MSKLQQRFRNQVQPKHTELNVEPIRIQKLLADYGYGSRRALDALLARGAIRVNDKVAALGDLACVRDVIYIHNTKVVFKHSTRHDEIRLLLYHKPALEICSRRDEQGRKTVFDALPKFAKKWHMVGRLDYTTTGLLLFTNNGALANFLMHPRYQHQRVYMVRALGEPRRDSIDRMERGIMVDGGHLQAARVEALGKQGDENAPANRWYRVVMTSGQNRAVRRLFSACDLEVSRLKRVAFCDIALPERLAAGKSQLLEAHVTQGLLKSMSSDTRSA